MKKTKLLTCCLLAILSTSSFANDNQKDINIAKNTDNPFYPKYLKENIKNAVDIIVNMQLREDRKKIAELQRKERERKERERKEKLKKEQEKNKESYKKIPSFLSVKSLTKNNLGEYEIVTKSGTILKKWVKVYGGTVSLITNSSIFLNRNENGIVKHYKIKYNVSF